MSQEAEERVTYGFLLPEAARQSRGVELPEVLEIEMRSATVSEHLRKCSSGSEEFQSGRDSTGLRVYNGSRVLCQFLAHLLGASEALRREFHGASTIELGCGCGLVSVFASHFAGRLLLTDREDLHFARRNIASASARCGINPPVGFATFEWSASAAASLAAERGPFDVIFASELVYFNTDPDLLIATISALLSASQQTPGRPLPVAILCHFNRLFDPSLLGRCISAHGLASLYIPLDAFLTPSAHQPPPIFFQGIELILLSTGDPLRLCSRFSPLFPNLDLSSAQSPLHSPDPSFPPPDLLFGAILPTDDE